MSLSSMWRSIKDTFSGGHYSRKEINKKAAAACEQIERLQTLLREDIKYIETAAKPRVVAQLQRNKQAFDVSVKGNIKQYDDKFYLLKDAARKNEIYTELSGLAANQSPKNDTIMLMQAKSTRDIVRSYDKLEFSYKSNEMNLVYQLANVVDAFEETMHDLDQAVRERKMKIEDYERQKDEVWARAAELKREATKNAMMNLVTLGVGALTGGIGGGGIGAAIASTSSMLLRQALGGLPQGGMIAGALNNLLTQQIPDTNFNNALSKMEVFTKFDPFKMAKGGVEAADMIWNGAKKYAGVVYGVRSEDDEKNLTDTAYHAMGKRVTDPNKLTDSSYDVLKNPAANRRGIFDTMTEFLGVRNK